MFAALASDIAILYGFYVWPKLIAAAFLLAALALVISPPLGRSGAAIWRVGALLGALLALGMLAHGASIYGIIPLVLIAAYRGIPSWRWIGAAAAVGVVMMGSWSAYQNYDDPPGNRLIKWHLAGVTEIDDRGSLETDRRQLPRSRHRRHDRQQVEQRRGHHRHRQGRRHRAHRRLRRAKATHRKRSSGSGSTASSSCCRCWGCS